MSTKTRAIAAVLAVLAASGSTVAIVGNPFNSAGVAPQVRAPTACARWGNTPATSLTVAQARLATYCQLNSRRKGASRPLLRMDRRLEVAAQGHSRFMVETKCFDHSCPGERSLRGRLNAVGYRGATTGEIIAFESGTNSTPRQIVRDWMNSPDHRRILLSRAFRIIGVGEVDGSPFDSGSGGVFTAVYGR